MAFFGAVGFYGVILYHLIIPTQEYDTSTLKLVHVVFRHGSRTKSELNNYPNDPYKNEIYYPYGEGQLTNKGKVQAFQIGEALRKRYDSFLGDLYTPDILYATTSKIDRNKMSLELVFAGLFPPGETLLNWNKSLNWQPIPYKEEPISSHIFGISLWSCPNSMKIYTDFMKSNAGLETLRPYQKLFDYVSNHSGENITSNSQLLVLYNTLSVQFDWGLKLPFWASIIYPEILSNGAMQFYSQLTAIPELRRLSGGFLLKKIIDDSNAKMLGTLIPQTRKLFLYSGHDLTIGNLLGVMGLYSNIPFASYLLIELHQIGNVYGIKIFLHNYSSSKPSWLTIPGCSKFCPIDTFVEMFGNYLPDENIVC